MSATGAQESTVRRIHASGAAESEAVAAFCQAVARGEKWFPALLQAIAGWVTPEEVWQGRQYCYLISGEAFDWLLLAERLLEEAGPLIPEEEKTRLLFDGEPPEPISASSFREMIGPMKHKAYVNYWYGVIVEQALQQAILEEAAKAHQGSGARERTLEEEMHQRLYGARPSELTAEFRMERGLPDKPESTLREDKERTYWLFKRRMVKSDPARLASDTRKGLLFLAHAQPHAGRWVWEATGEE